MLVGGTKNQGICGVWYQSDIWWVYVIAQADQSRIDSLPHKRTFRDISLTPHRFFAYPSVLLCHLGVSGKVTDSVEFFC